MNSCCLQYYIIPEDDSDVKKLEIESSECDSCHCHCGYIQYESLAPYMPKLTNNATKDEDYLLLEARLKQQIVEISRLFDVATQAEEGTYSKAHYKVIKLYGNGSTYLEIPEFVPGTLELYTEDGYLINPDTYTIKDNFLIIKPCSSHSSTCGCNESCGIYNKRYSKPGWEGCFQIKAKFGKECADQAVQMAIRLYLIEVNTFGDEKETVYQGLTPRKFREPHAWTTLVQKYLQTRKLNNYFGYA